MRVDESHRFCDRCESEGDDLLKDFREGLEKDDYPVGGVEGVVGFIRFRQNDSVCPFE